MMRKAAFFFLVAAAIMASGAQGGHELPVYPSFYPHEIAIKTIAAAMPMKNGIHSKPPFALP